MNDVIEWLESPGGQAWSREFHNSHIMSWFQLKDDNGMPVAFQGWDVDYTFECDMVYPYPHELVNA